MVCCGVCQQVFNGNWNLIDSLPSQALKQTVDQTAPAQIVGNIGDDSLSSDSSGRVAAATESTAMTENGSVDTLELSVKTRPAISNHQQSELATSGFTEKPVTDRLDEAEGLSTASRPSRKAQRRSGSTTNDGTLRVSGIPEFSGDHRSRGPDIHVAILPEYRRRSVWLWLLMLFAVTALIIWQLGYFFFDTLARNQGLRPLLSRACEVLDCRLPVRSNPALLVLFNTRIISHPADPQAVRVISELQNHAEFSQPAPQLQLSLSDPRGVVIARRVFSPSAYLEPGQRADIAAGQSRQIILDLAGPGKSAVGFELKIVVPRRLSGNRKPGVK